MNLEGDRCEDTGFCLSRSIKVNEHEKFPGVSILEMVKDSFCSRTVRILCLHRSSNSSLSVFYNTLETFHTTYKMLDIILGDFSINVIANNDNLQQVMPQYQLRWLLGLRKLRSSEKVEILQIGLILRIA